MRMLYHLHDSPPALPVRLLPVEKGVALLGPARLSCPECGEVVNVAVERLGEKEGREP